MTSIGFLLRASGCVLACALVLQAAGCTTRVPFVSPAAGSIRVESLRQSPVALSGQLETSLYGDDNVETTFILSDAPFERMLGGDVARGQIVHIELLWLPRPGWTPMSADATNASIRYVIIADGEVGVYAGAGFAIPQGDIGGSSLKVSLRDASLKLVDQTPGFVDLLTPAKLSGTFTATHNPRATRQAHYAMSQIVTDALGRSIFVNADDQRQLCMNLAAASLDELLNLALASANQHR